MGKPEILVIDDGSADNTADVVRSFPTVRLITQANAGPAAARNRGAAESHGSIILFTDDDCVSMPDWLDAMLQPFHDPEVVGVKGVYRTHQRELAARFVQIEYEDRYRLMARHCTIDFVDTYSAAFRRERFLEMNGYDTSFPIACAEDIELSYRMSARGWKMKFAPDAIVYHTHPNTFSAYLRKKYKFAFWRVLAVRKNPSKAVKDSHTPQLMKLQLLFAPALLLALIFDFIVHPRYRYRCSSLRDFYSALCLSRASFRQGSRRRAASPGAARGTCLGTVVGSCLWTTLCPPKACRSSQRIAGLNALRSSP